MLSNISLWSYLYKDSSINDNVEILKDENRSNEKDQIEEIQKDNLLNTDKAKEWGSYILEVGKTATNRAAKQVSSTAKQIRQNVSEIKLIEQTNIISKFSDEQTKFMTEKRLIEKKKQEICLPWYDALNKDDGEPILKTKILLISSDERNFVRNPPPGSGYEFNYDLQAPVAQLLLKEDKVLAEMRYKLVPKKISEDLFWRNYFYRVFLIKQSLETDKDGMENTSVALDHPGSEQVTEASDERDCASNETGSRTELSKEESEQLKTITRKMDSGKDNEEWEAELQKELSEFELINEGNGHELLLGEDKGDYDDLEREILNELEK